MYAVVGCSDCEHLWVVEGTPETTECRRCGSRHTFRDRRRLAEATDPDEARELRSQLLAARSDSESSPPASFHELEDRVADGVIETVHPVTIAEEDGPPTDRVGLVRHALETLEEPDRTELVAYCTDHGLTATQVERTLEALLQAGAVTRESGSYRAV